MIPIEEVTVLVEVVVEFVCVLVIAFCFLRVMTVTFFCWLVFGMGWPWCCRMMMAMMATVMVCRCV